MNDITGPSKGLVERAKAIITSPKTEWPVIAGETDSTSSVLMKYALPLALISPICTVLGSFLAPINLGLSFYIATAIVTFVLGIAMLYVLAFAANFLSPKFGGKDDFAAAFRLVVYSWTPAWVVGVVGLVSGVVPVLGLLGFLALIYGLYLFYLGATSVMGVPQDKAMTYTIIYVVVAIVLYLVVGGITTAIVAATVVSAMPNSVVVYTGN